MWLTNANSSTVQNNVLNLVTNGIVLYHTSLASIIGNQVHATGTALSFLNTTSSSIQNNNMQGGVSGIYCSLSSNVATNGNQDLGNNACSINSCTWMSSSDYSTCK
jgi:parallel beta-helix repeat protein